MGQFIFLGDSITDCSHSFTADNLGDGYVRMIADAVGTKHQVINFGIDGFTVSAVNRLWNQKSDTVTPDLITILVGVNDLAMMMDSPHTPDKELEQFRTRYHGLLDTILRSTNCPILLMEPFIFPKPAQFILWQPQLRQINAAILELAQMHQIQFLPLWNSLLKEAEICGIDQITTDGIHLTKRGHRVLADAWLHAVSLR